MKYPLAILAALLLAAPCVAQVGLSVPPPPTVAKINLLGWLGEPLSSYLEQSKPQIREKPAPLLSVLAANTAAYQLPKQAFFCRWETKMEKAARVPVKFRLGEVQYTEGLEGKRD